MTRILLSAVAILASASASFANPVTLKGKAAEAFIAKNFPKADIPGDVAGVFTYAHHGGRRTGRAQCSVPAMGARSEGAVSTCKVWY
jgi:hypothetical protein